MTSLLRDDSLFWRRDFGGHVKQNMGNVHNQAGFQPALRREKTYLGGNTWSWVQRLGESLGWSSCEQG